jgi:hypothetical protein
MSDEPGADETGVKKVPFGQRSAVRALRAPFKGAAFPFFAVIVAFLVSGLVVLATGRNPLPVYRELFKGAGLDYLFGWVPGTNVNMQLAETNLISTLVTTIPLILAGLCVAFAFRAGLFNIGGTGQFFAGMVAAFWIADLGKNLNGFVVVVLALLGAIVASGIYGAIPGYLKAYRGAHEVITTIMLNWIAIYMGQYLFGLTGPLKGPTENPISVDIPDQAKLPVFWGNIQGLHVGLFLALAAAVVFSLIFRRTSFGYDVDSDHGDERDLRRTCRRHRGAWCALPHLVEHLRGRADRIHRYRRRPAWAQHGDRVGARRLLVWRVALGFAAVAGSLRRRPRGAAQRHRPGCDRVDGER